MMMIAAAGLWRPYALRPSEPDQGRPEPAIVEIGNWEQMGQVGAAAEFVTEWPIDAVLKNLVNMAAGWYERAKRRRAPLHADVRQWITSTRAHAHRLPLGGPHPRAQMLAVAATIERLIDWPREYFQTTRPSLDTKADAEFRCSLTVWALDQLLTTINTLEHDWARRRAIEQERPQVRLRIPPTRFWPAMFPGELLPFCDYATAQKRVHSISNSVTPGRESQLMADILRTVIEHGYFDADGAPRLDSTLGDEIRYPATPLK